MSFVKFFHYNLIRQDVTDILPDTEDAFFKADNLKSHFRSKVYRTPDGTLTAGVTFDFITTEGVDSVLYKSGLESVGFVGDLTIKANPTNASWGSPAFSTTLSVSEKFDVGFVTFPEESYRFWRVEASNPTGDYVELSKLFIGKHLSLEDSNSNIDFGWSWLYSDPSKIQRNRYQERFIDKLPQTDGISASLKLLNKTEMGKVMDMFTTNGTTEPVWFITDEGGVFSDDKHRFTTMGFFDRIPRPTNTHFSLYSVDFRIVP